MGWSQELSDSEKITDEELESILVEIDAQHTLSIPGWGWSKQSWGWSTECDISRRDFDRLVIFSGAWFSFETDLPQRFEAAARLRGHSVTLGERTG
jgi:hypothetical protein